MRVYIDGAENTGWHVDVERKHIENALSRMGIHLAQNPLKADVIHNIWWSAFLLNRTRWERVRLYFKKKNVLMTASSYLHLDDPHYARQELFKHINKYTFAWIAPSLKQQRLFRHFNIPCYYLPFYLDLELFTPNAASTRRRDIGQRFGIPESVYKDKVIIGSFQRDSDGHDLSRPKWAKGPELLIELLKDLPKHAFVLLLAGPRRHYVIKKCKEYRIPYWYIGTETDIDDIRENAVNVQEMPKLYTFVDLYLVTANSEGGPKAVMEAAATKTNIFSTDVGLAADILNAANVFRDNRAYKKAVYDFVMLGHARNNNDIVDEQHKTCIKLLNQKFMDKRLKEIYAAVVSGG
jgi:glycosyltransferase involved in cell wall biosynthesis